MARKFRNLLITAFAIGMGLLPHMATYASPPQLPPLTPPPPSFLTCRAVGDGAICEGTRTVNEGLVDTGIVCGSGASAFDIFDQGIFEDHVIRYYDQEGNLTRRVIHSRWHATQWSNPATGTAVPYTQHQEFTDVLAVPGDFSSATETVTGEIVLNPLHSAPVFFSTGRVVTAPDGTIEFRSGQQNFLDLFVDGDVSVLAPLCAALAGP